MIDTNYSIIGELGNVTTVAFTYNGTTVGSNQITKGELFYDSEEYSTCMRCFEFTLNNDIGLNVGDTVSNVTVSVVLDNQSATIPYGDYIVYEAEKDAETGDITYLCYDYMLKAMVEYDMEVTYPITLKNYVKSLANKLGFSFDLTKTYVNQNVQLTEEQFSEMYTYRDVLDYVAQATASLVWIKNGELLLSYPNVVEYEITGAGVMSATTNGSYGRVDSVVLGRSETDDIVVAKDDAMIEQYGLCEIRFDDNPFLDTIDDTLRYQYALNILNKVKGTYYEEFSLRSFGNMVLEPNDVFSLTLLADYESETSEETTYRVICVKNKLTIDDGVEESIEWKKPSANVSDYTTTNFESLAKKTYIKVDKVNQKINSVVEEVDEHGSRLTMLEQTSSGITITVSELSTDVQNAKEEIETAKEEMTTFLYIDSSRGTVFKNDSISTLLSVVVYRGSDRITDMATLKQKMGNSVYLQWKWQRLNESEFGIISADDSRIGNDGFTFLLSPEDVDTKVTFLCELIK